MKAAHWEDGPVLVLGAHGMLGQALMHRFREHLAGKGCDAPVGWDIAELDIRNREAVSSALRRLRPAVVVNAAAYTDVDGCESESELAFAVNADGAGHIACACAAIGATMLHLSTDFIFDGHIERPYLPDDPPNPLSVYGRTKWAGEQNVRNSGCRYLVLRTAWMFGPGGHNFVEAIIAQAAAGDPLRVVTDQLGSPTFAVHLADAIVRLLDIDAQGTVHFTNSGQCSWFQFAEEIVRQACVDVRVYGICTADLERPARRPGYSVLDTGGYVELTGHTPVPWNDALDEYLIHRSKRGHTAAGLCAPNTESLAE